MTFLKLMPDYECYPLWEASPGKVGNVDPSTLPISSALRTDLLRWGQTFDATLKPDDPLSSGFDTSAAEEAFKEQGIMLADRLKSELGEDYTIILKV